MSVTEPGLRRLRMSWEDFLALPEQTRTEWVDGEVVVTPPVGFSHGQAVIRLGSALLAALPGTDVVTEVGVWLPRNRLRGPDLMVLESPPGDVWVHDAPVLVVEVLSPSTRGEDLVRKAPEYAEGGVGQFWVVDPDARVIDVYANVQGRWEPLLHLDSETPTGQVPVGEHGVVPLDLAEILPV